MKTTYVNIDAVDTVEWTNGKNKKMELPRILHIVHMQHIFSVTRPTLSRLEKEGKIPSGNRTFGNPRWNRNEVLALIS